MNSTLHSSIKASFPGLMLSPLTCVLSACLEESWRAGADLSNNQRRSFYVRIHTSGGLVTRPHNVAFNNEKVVTKDQIKLQLYRRPMSLLRFFTLKVSPNAVLAGVFWKKVRILDRNWLKYGRTSLKVKKLSKKTLPVVLIECVWALFTEITIWRKDRSSLVFM